MTIDTNFDFMFDPPCPPTYRCDVCDGAGYVSDPSQSDCICVCHAGYRQRENEDPRQRDYCGGCKETGHPCSVCGGSGETDYIARRGGDDDLNHDMMA